MVRNLQNYILIIVFSICVQICLAEVREDYQSIVNQHQFSCNNCVFSLLDDFTFLSQKHGDLIFKIEKQCSDCLIEFDETLNVNIFKREFVKSHLYNLKTDSIVINKITDLNTCSNLDIKKLICFVSLKNQNKSVPINLIIINLSRNERKILLDIINENYFSNEKL